MWKLLKLKILNHITLPKIKSLFVMISATSNKMADWTTGGRESNNVDEGVVATDILGFLALHAVL